MDNTQKQYRPGPLGALMDEYQKVAAEFEAVLLSISEDEFVKILDTQTQDPSCVSVQAICAHVVRCGYNYANYIRKQWHEPITGNKKNFAFSSPQEVIAEMKLMLAYTEETLANKNDLTFQDVLDNIIKSGWGQNFDLEQLLEHAIVHILRHRRQIEKLLGR